jgi:GAF domain-containing protein
MEPSNVSAYAALTGKSVKIDDVYASEEFDFTGPRNYDRRTGYRSRSMLVVPMKDREGSVIGVLQLINAVDPETGEICAFSDDVLGLAEALASQAAVALANARLIEETKRLFESLIKVLAVALDAKSPYTGNHVQRVALLNTALAKAVNEAVDGPFADVRFSRDEMGAGCTTSGR